MGLGSSTATPMDRTVLARVQLTTLPQATRGCWGSGVAQGYQWLLASSPLPCTLEISPKAALVHRCRPGCQIPKPRSNPMATWQYCFCTNALDNQTRTSTQMETGGAVLDPPQPQPLSAFIFGHDSFCKAHLCTLRPRRAPQVTNHQGHHTVPHPPTVRQSTHSATLSTREPAPIYQCLVLPSKAHFCAGFSTAFP